MLKHMRIPAVRISILIGKKGEVKHRIEKELDVKIQINDEITIEGEDVLHILDAENIIKAIGRGFPPDKALLLLKEGYTIEIIPLPKDKRQLIRIRSRIIGKEGRAKANLERLTNTHASVSGKSVAIIGQYERADIARQAIHRFIKGYSHRSIWSWLEKKVKELKSLEMQQ